MNDQFFQQKNERKYIRLTQCYDQLYDELFRMEAHAHEGIELMFVIEGRINFFFSVAGMVKQYSIAADEFVIFDSIAVNRDWRKIQKKYGKTAQKRREKYCVQLCDNIYPEDWRFSIADSNVTYRSLLKAFAQANIRNPILPIRRLRFNGQPYKNKSKPRADRTTSKNRV